MDIEVVQGWDLAIGQQGAGEAFAVGGQARWMQIGHVWFSNKSTGLRRIGGLWAVRICAVSSCEHTTKYGLAASCHSPCMWLPHLGQQPRSLGALAQLASQL